jgi:hypothetical protein
MRLTGRSLGAPALAIAGLTYLSACSSRDSSSPPIGSGAMTTASTGGGSGSSLASSGEVDAGSSRRGGSGGVNAEGGSAGTPGSGATTGSGGGGASAGAVGSAGVSAGDDSSTATGGSTDDAGVDAVAEVGAPCSTNPGTALQFEGQTPDLVRATIAQLPIGRASRTIELWAYFDGTPSSWVNEHGLFETGDNEGIAGMQCHEFALNSTAWGSGQTLAMLHPYGNCNSVDNFFNLPADTFPQNSKTGWVHISFGYDMTANSFQFTINGNAMLDIGTGAGAAGRTHPEDNWPAEPGWGTTSYPAGNWLSIGTTPQFAGPTGWQGKIDEFRVWSIFRTAADIRTNMRVMLRGDEPGLVAYYKFDEGTGTTIADATGDPTNDAHMVLTQGYAMTPPKWVTSDIPGTFTCAP